MEPGTGSKVKLVPVAGDDEEEEEWRLIEPWLWPASTNWSGPSLHIFPGEIWRLLQRYRKKTFDNAAN